MIKILAVLPSAYGARLLLAPAALGLLRLTHASSEFQDGARNPFAAAYIDGAQVLANRPVATRKV